MNKEIVYGPVSSWRLGKSLGIDLICRSNVCSFNCRYCQLGPTEEKTLDRRVFVETEEILNAVEKALKKVDPQVLTLSGTGEPTLAANISEVVAGLHKISSLPVALLTNGSLLYREDVRRDIAELDVIVGKLDAPNSSILQKLNRAHPDITVKNLISGQKKVAAMQLFFSLEVMLTADNIDYFEDLAQKAAEIDPDEVQLNTPRRESAVEPQDCEKINLAAQMFRNKNLTVRSICEETPPPVSAFLGKEKLKHLKRADGR